MNYNLNTSYQTTVDTARQNKVLRNTYMLLALSLIPTIAGALMGINMNFGFMRASPIMSSLLMIGGIYGMFFLIEKNRDSGVGVALLLALTFLLGLLLGPLLQVALSVPNGGQLITIAAGGTAIVFFGMATLATVIKRDLGFLNKFLLVGG
ncbi:Bax inhibitor-1 family protein, partial [Laribacter hongkongensis]